MLALSCLWPVNKDQEILQALMLQSRLAYVQETQKPSLNTDEQARFYHSSKTPQTEVKGPRLSLNRAPGPMGGGGGHR